MQNNDQENKSAKDKADEAGQILVDEHIKITDPNSGEVIVDKRETS